MSDNPAVHKEAFRLLVGEKIGWGVGREVWTSRLNERDVIKIEDRAESFQNIIEWEMWRRVQFTPFAKWFAPCLHISPCGSVLVMRRTERIPRSMYPKQVPAFLTDLKRDNYGLFRGKVVCHDYGTHIATERGLNEKMRAAKWWA